MTAPTIVALIPARGGSTRIPRKNLADLGGHPLLAYTIAAARTAGIFAGIHVSTDDPEIARTAERYSASVIERPADLAADLAPDIGWVLHAMRALRGEPWRPSSTRTVGEYERPAPDAFAILRPTSPFRSAATIRAAWDHLRHHGAFAVDSLRAVEPARQHPYKMWRPQGAFIAPLADLLDLPSVMTDAPLHSSPGQIFPTVLAQNASLEMAWRHVLDMDPPTISGTRILPWTMPAHEGQDINDPNDLDYCRWLVESGRATLPEVS